MGTRNIMAGHNSLYSSPDMWVNGLDYAEYCMTRQCYCTCLTLDVVDASSTAPASSPYTSYNNTSLSLNVLYLIPVSL